MQSKGLARVFSNTTVPKISSSVLSFLHSPTLTSIHDYRKNHSLDYERLLLSHANTPGFLAAGEEFNPGPETRLDCSELLIEKASDIGIRRGQKEYPPASLQLDVIQSLAVC